MGLASCVISCQQKYEKKEIQFITLLLTLQESLLEAKHFCFVSVLVPMQGTAAAVRRLRWQTLSHYITRNKKFSYKNYK